MRAMDTLLLAVLLGLQGAAALAAEGETVGQRPYEMVWANRNQDEHPPLVDFEDLAGWTAQCKASEASFVQSREQQLWGKYVGKLTYRGTGAGPEVRLTPPQPIPIKQPFDAVTLWVYGNNWGWAPNPDTPQVTISAIFEDAAGKEFAVTLYHVDWTEWNLLHRRLTPEQIERVKQGARFKGILVAGGRNKQNRVLYFDNLAVYTERFAPLKFEPRPARGIPMFPGEGVGTNTGPGKLPFPTRPETILPDNLVKGYRNAVANRGDGFTLSYAGSDGQLTYRLQPKSGTWSDVTATWTPAGGKPVEFHPCSGGGAWLQTPQGPKAAEKADSLGSQLAGQEVRSRWRLSAGGVSAEVTYTYRIWGKSLVIDTVAPGGQVAEVRYGRAQGLANPRLVTNPFYPAQGGRPAVVVSGPTQQPLFVTGNTDWYLSNASTMWAANAVDADGALYNGGTRYIPKTDGKRNDCYERFFLTVSPRYEEVLPNIPNPRSPWMKVTGTHLWRAHGASNRENDARFWTECHRWGMTQVVITDHETGWRDGGESFTFRTRTAPGKGGDKGQFDYARLMQDKLGFIYGPYNNYTDFAPVNEYWNTDMVSRTPDNQLQHAWMRCYAPKPARAVEYCEKLAPQIQAKFHFSTAYCDVHTAVAPWDRVDYDARVPGAGTFAAVFYAFGEIMLLQKKAWNGPVYSEGNHHAFYSGLTDGNYGQDQAYRPAENPWLVDFDLRKMHPLCCNFGMGNPGMFYANAKVPQRTQEEKDAYIDRFLAATVAFGHPGFLAFEGGTRNALRSYYMLQQLHSRYCLADAAEIRYGTADGKLEDTSAAVASGAYRRSQVVTRYTDGTVTAANGSRTERLVTTAYGRKIDLPPNGYCGWTADGAIQVWSTDRAGHRCDAAVTPAYLYADGRGKFTRFAKAASDGPAICRILPDGGWEVIPFQGADCGFAVAAGSAKALDKDGKEMGPAALRVARGLTYVVPVPDAFSYLLSPGKAPAGIALTCDRDEVVAGERVTILGKEAHEVQIPADAKPGQRLWMQFEGAWIDFTVVPLADTQVSLAGNTLKVALTSNLARAEEFRVRAGAAEQAVRLQPGRPAAVTFDLGAPKAESAEELPIEVRAGEMVQRTERGLRTVSEVAELVPLPAKWTAGMCLRGEKERSDFGQTMAQCRAGETTCGDVTRAGIFMHPPYQGGVGYTFALFDPVALPAEPPAAFRAFIGKGDGSDPGDGILYKVVVVDEAGAEAVVAEHTVTEHRWEPIEADLSRWAGKKVRLKLIADVGVRDDSSGDWSCWAEMRIETLGPVLHRSLEAGGAEYRREPGPYPVAGLTVDDLRKAKSGWLRYDGKGLEGEGQYGSTAVLNGVELGNMAPAHGDETKGVWAEKVGVPLTPAAIRTLGLRNRFVLRNPAGDSFSIRRFWIELALADGRKCSSEISAATYTQPPEWPFAEGIGVPFGQEIAVDVWFRL